MRSVCQVGCLFLAFNLSIICQVSCCCRLHTRNGKKRSFSKFYTTLRTRVEAESPGRVVLFFAQGSANWSPMQSGRETGPTNTMLSHKSRNALQYLDPVTRCHVSVVAMVCEFRTTVTHTVCGCELKKWKRVRGLKHCPECAKRLATEQGKDIELVLLLFFVARDGNAAINITKNGVEIYLFDRPGALEFLRDHAE